MLTSMHLRGLISWLFALTCFGMLMAGGCVKNPVSPEAMKQRTATSWAYWLQHPDPDALARNGCDIVVMDYSRDGSDAEAFRPQDLAPLENRKVLAYFSIGEAETYRFYWQPDWQKNPPEFLGPENPDWEDNYKVRYWKEEWWETALKPYLDRILAAGFDGLYLDIVDAYWFWHEEGRDLTQAANDMVALVERIAQYAREKTGRRIVICPQNGLSILDDASPEMVRRYMKTVDYVAVESLFFNIYSEEDQGYRMQLVRRVLVTGKPVLSVEYIDAQDIDLYKKKAAAFPGLIPFASSPDAALDGLPYPCMMQDR